MSSRLAPITKGSPAAKTRSEIGAAIYRNKNADVTELRRRLRAERLEAHIEEVLSEAPPLTAEMRDNLAALLTGYTAEHAESA